ncbi:Pre-mRNA-splicing factor spp2 [Hondaea fermentalgiana]|uniref:Pre-mRNA-splicing factor spp2 n=1 Tax=Hondaea fermentalgiana TaxID=2315210 RepID=A0A2R5GLE4_9STRA|nr:Pre-mRNA-splicing factor spp2 [Hondaea fermentalgiana]|eukprot:GBG31129.1 Pre-mRNA-splicing factor spp2 [Hondaea fermentalgiana]
MDSSASSFRAVKLKTRRGVHSNQHDGKEQGEEVDDAFAAAEEEEEEDERSRRNSSQLRDAADEADAEPKEPVVIPLVKSKDVDESLPMLLRNQPAAIRAIADEKERLERHIQDLPDSSEKQYEAVSIDDFGAAMLRGMGWNPAAGNGEKGSSAAGPAPSIPRPALLGLGATPKQDIEALLKERKRRKLAESGQAEKKTSSVNDTNATSATPKFRPGWIEDGSLVKFPKSILKPLGNDERGLSLQKAEDGAQTSAKDDDQIFGVVTQADSVPGLNNILVEVDNDVVAVSSEEDDRIVKVKRDLVEVVDHTQLADENPCIAFRNRVLARVTKARNDDDDESSSGDDSQLSTALPKRGGRVLVVRGRATGARGQLVDRSNSRALATVQIDGEHGPVKLDYDEVAELVVLK